MDAPEPHLPLTTDINGATLSHRVCRALLVGWMQALFAPESTAGSIRALSPRRLVAMPLH